MKRFELWQYDRETEQLEEAVQPIKGSNVKDILNNLQQHWNENAVTGRKYLSKGIYPIMTMPYDVKKKGGILTIGINPGTGGDVDKLYDSWLKANKNVAPKVYENGRGWVNLSPKWVLDPNNKKSIEQGKVNVQTTGKLPSKFNATIWIPNKKQPVRPSSYSPHGAATYFAALNTIFQRMGLPNLRKQMIWTNSIPFPSPDAGRGGKGASEASKLRNKEFKDLSVLCAPYVEAFIKETQPKLIVVAHDVFTRYILQNGGTRSKGSLTIELRNRDGSKRTKIGVDEFGNRIYQTGMFHGVPVISLMHWSGFPASAPETVNYDPNDPVAKHNMFLMGQHIKQMMETGSTATELKSSADLEDAYGQWLYYMEDDPSGPLVKKGDAKEIFDQMMGSKNRLGPGWGMVIDIANGEDPETAFQPFESQFEDYFNWED